MPGGEVQIENFCVAVENNDRISPDPLDVPAFPLFECCFELPALALNSGDPDAGDEFKNDKHSVLFVYDVSTLTVAFELEQYDGSAWVKVADITDNTYGTFYDLGFAAELDDSFGTPLPIIKYAGFEIDWQLVITLIGEGSYRIKTVETDITSNVTNQYSFEFCLQKYTAFRADKTTRFTWYQRGVIGDRINDKLTFNYKPSADEVGGDGWFNQLRLPESFFGFNRSSYEREYVRYTNGQQVYIQDEQIEEYTFNSGMYDDVLHNYIKSEILQADRIEVTDYNKNNHNASTLQNKAVKPNSNYEPNWQYNNRRAMVELTFIQEYQNRFKKRC